MADWLNRLQLIEAEPDEPSRATSVDPREVIIVAYQRFSLDYDLPDGTYTPTQLRQARVRVTSGPVLRYRLRWPGGTPQPMTPQESPTR